ncbi:MAG: glycerol-3-phosphate 1-O-acyltransferase PlsY [Nitrospirota bacterium]
MLKIFLLLIAGFLLGSIPFGIIIAKLKGVNLKKVGSGNIGATNVLRSLGKWPAALTLIGDILKGTMAVVIGRLFEVESGIEGLIGISAILGHNFSVFLGFRGGKGVATSIGVLLVYAPVAALLTLVLWLTVVFLTKYSSLGAIVSLGILPFTFLLMYPGEREKLIIAISIAVIILVRHRDNLQRLMKGTERKVGQRE